eukprot:scaffold45409_cov31-Tisochrysis_lutea.AAC.1
MVAETIGGPATYSLAAEHLPPVGQAARIERVRTESPLGTHLHGQRGKEGSNTSASGGVRERATISEDSQARIQRARRRSSRSSETRSG